MPLNRQTWLRYLTTASLTIAVLTPVAKAGEVTLAAAASLKDALDVLKPEIEKALSGLTLSITTAGSGTLQQQIAQGAPIDIFISAAAKPMEALDKAKQLTDGSRKILLTNDLVLIAPEKSTVLLKSIDDLKDAKVKKIAIGEPRSVPAGDYAMQTLKTLKLDETLTPKFVYAKDVRQVLSYVERGEVEAGFVYSSDLLANNAGAVKLIQKAPSDTHQPIVYEIALVAKDKIKVDSKRLDDTKKVAEYLEGKAAALTWTRFGFGLPASKTADQGPGRAPL